jgi:hypothetical protein
MADFYQAGVIATLEREPEFLSWQAPGLKLATEEFFADPLGASAIANWMRVSAALPGFLDDLKEAADADNELTPGAVRFWVAG